MIQPDNRGWELTIREQRRQLQLQLEQSPSLKLYFTEQFDDCWQYALAQVKGECAKEYEFNNLKLLWGGHLARPVNEVEELYR